MDNKKFINLLDNLLGIWLLISSLGFISTIIYSVYDKFIR